MAKKDVHDPTRKDIQIQTKLIALIGGVIILAKKAPSTIRLGRILEQLSKSIVQLLKEMIA